VSAPQFRDFQDVLTDLDDGHVHEELTARLRDLVTACRDSQQPGKLTLTINVKPDGRQFVVVPKVTAQIPTRKAGITMFFADDAGDLRRDDPRQQQLRDVVNAAAQPLRTLATEG
jgi:hypothetical protein